MRKKFFILSILIVFFLSGFKTRGRCYQGYVQYWPDNKVICANSIFMIEGMGTAQGIVKKLGKKFRIYLVSDNERIECNQMEFCEGEYKLNQVILKPSHSLRVGKTYKFESYDLIQSSQYQKVSNTFELDIEKHAWLVDVEIDSVVPKWTETARWTGGDASFDFGCGPIITSDFACGVSEKNDFLIKVTLEDFKIGRLRTYYLRKPSEKGMLFIGRGMCSGEFKLRAERDYGVTFDLFDASGNATLWHGEPIEFPSPRKRVLTYFFDHIMTHIFKIS